MNLKSKKILFIESGYFSGGSFESMFQHISNIDRNLYEPHVLFTNENKYCSKLSKLNIKYDIIQKSPFNRKNLSQNKIRLTFFLYLQNFLTFLFPSISILLEEYIHKDAIAHTRNFIKNNSITLVHTNNQVDRDLYGIISAISEKIDCICHLRSVNTKRFNRKKAIYINQNVKEIIAYSLYVAEKWVKKGLDDSKIQIINNAIENIKETAKINLHTKYNIHKHVKIIGIVGLIIPERNHQLLFNALSELIKRKKNIHLIVVGAFDNEKLKSNLSKQIRKLGISKHITFTGPKNNAKEIISSLDLLTLPYTIEPFGKTLLEAWQLKVPVAISKVGHINKIVTNEKNGLLFDLNNLNQFVNILETGLYNERIRKVLISNAYQDCIKLFSIESYVNKIDKIYQKYGN